MHFLSLSVMSDLEQVCGLLKEISRPARVFLLQYIFTPVTLSPRSHQPLCTAERAVPLPPTPSLLSPFIPIPWSVSHTTKSSKTANNASAYSFPTGMWNFWNQNLHTTLYYEYKIMRGCKFTDVSEERITFILLSINVSCFLLDWPNSSILKIKAICSS
jgi:hypothetical protein